MLSSLKAAHKIKIKSAIRAKYNQEHKTSSSSRNVNRMEQKWSCISLKESKMGAVQLQEYRPCRYRDPSGELFYKVLHHNSEGPLACF